MDRALFLLGADVPEPIVAKNQVVVKVLSKKEKEALEAKKKDEAKRKKIADALAAQQAGGKPKATKKQAEVAKAKAEGRELPVAAEPKKPAPKPKPKAASMPIETGIAEMTLAAPMPEKVVSYRSRTLEQMIADRGVREAHDAVETRKRAAEQETKRVRQYIAKGQCKLTLDEWALLRTALGADAGLFTDEREY